MQTLWAALVVVASCASVAMTAAYARRHCRHDFFHRHHARFFGQRKAPCVMLVGERRNAAAAPWLQNEL